MTRHKRRWGDNDRHFGPFTFAARETWRPLSALISSGSSDAEEGGCHIRLQALGMTLICELPAIVKPSRSWVDTSRYEWNKGNPNAGYWDEHPREFGVSLHEGLLMLKLGRQTHDSSTTQDWGWFLPWTQWRLVSHRLFLGNQARQVAHLEWKAQHAILEAFPRINFLIQDFDGEKIKASVYVEERQWRLGTGWFRWLGYLRTRRIRRSLDIRFDKELGPEKGSWKGGTLGHGIEMLPGETPEQAMRRYCDQEHRAKSRRFKIRFLEAVA